MSPRDYRRDRFAISENISSAASRSSQNHKILRDSVGDIISGDAESGPNFTWVLSRPFVAEWLRRLYAGYREHDQSLSGKGEFREAIIAADVSTE